MKNVLQVCTRFSFKNFWSGPLLALLLVAQVGWAQPVWESFTQATGDGTSIVLNRPTGIVENDLMVVALYLEKGTGGNVNSVPSGWVLILSTNQSSDFGMRTYYKVAGASEPASYTFGLNTSGKWSATNSRITGADPATPVGTPAGGGGNSGSTVSPSVTSTANNLILSFHGRKNTGNLTLNSGPSGTVKQFQVNGSDVSNALFTFVQASAGSTGTVTTNGGSNYWNTQQIPIRPGAACTPPTFTACPPPNTSVNTGAGICTAVVNYTATATGTPSPTITYAFSGATTDSGSGTGSGSSFNQDVTTVTITANNGCAPNAICEFTVTVTDNQNPTITTCPITRNISGCNTSAITGPVYSTTSAGSSYAEFSNATNQGVATDNCAITSVTYIDVAAGTCPIVVSRTWTVSDGVNSTVCTQTINVTDNVAPTASNPSNITGVKCVANVPAADPSVVTDEADNCGGTPTVALQSETNNGGTGCAASPYRTSSLGCTGLRTPAATRLT